MEIRVPVDENKLSPEVKEAMAKLEEAKNKKYSKEYYAMMDKNSNAVHEIAETTTPWDWSYGLDFLIAHLRWMRDYYKLGENVHSQEDKEWKKGVKHTRLEAIELTLKYYDMWQTVEDRYIQIVEHPETYHETPNDDGTVTVDDLGFHCVYKCGTMKRTYKKMAKEEKKWQKKFYKMLMNHLQEWWD